MEANDVFHLKPFLNSVLFSILGLLIYGAGFWVVEHLVPGKLWKEIIEEHNTALAIIIGSMALGVAYIIGSAVHGG